MVYNKLLLSEGGGLTSVSQQADQVANTATVLIGLGGTGVSCLRHIKTQVYNRLKPDDVNDPIPKYQRIQFLGVDTDFHSFGDDSNNDEQNKDKKDTLAALSPLEMLNISNPNANDIVSNKNILQQRGDMEWFVGKDKLPPINFSLPGAGGIRQVGRLLFRDKADEFYNAVLKAINSARTGLDSPRIQVHVFAGISGGTGSGAFLDACYIIQKILNELKVNNAIAAYFFQPDVNLSKIPLNNKATIMGIKQNGYAAMQELDYCMRLGRNGDAFTQEYKNIGTVDWSGSPVGEGICCLISSKNAQGSIRPDGYEYAMNVVTEYVMSFIMDSVQEFSVDSELSNYSGMFSKTSSSLTMGSELRYVTLGAACLTVPSREINTYLAAALFDHYQGIENNQPDSSEVHAILAEAWANSNCTSIDSLHKAIADEIQCEPTFDSFPEDLSYVTSHGTQCMKDYYDGLCSNFIGKMVANSENLLSGHEWIPETEKGETRKGNTSSFVSRLIDKLDSRLKSETYGPIYVSRLFNEVNGNNIIDIIDGLKAKNATLLDEKQKDYLQRLKEFNVSQEKFEKAFFGTKTQKYKVFNTYMKYLREADMEIERYKKIDEVLKTLKEQLEKLHDVVFFKLRKVFEELLQTFKLNYAYLNSLPQQSLNHGFEKPMMTIEELKPALNLSVQATLKKNVLGQLVKQLLEDISYLDESKNNDLMKLLVDFFIKDAFSGYSSKTIEEFLQDKYNTQNVSVISNKVFNDFIANTALKAEILFPFDTSVWGINLCSLTSSISLPQASPSIKQAVSNLVNNNGWKTYDSSFTDRIYFLKRACAFPAFANNELSLYQDSYFNDTNPGKHYFEGINYQEEPASNSRFTDWNQLPPLKPLSIINNYSTLPKKAQDILTKASDTYNKALNAGLLKLNNNDVNLYLFANKDTFEAELSNVEENIETVNTIAGLNQLKNSLKLPSAENSKLSYKIEGSVNHQNSLMKDYFINSPVIQKAVEADLELYDRYIKIVKLIEDKDALLHRRNLIMKQFKDTLFTGLIEFNGNVISVTEKADGLKTQHVLSQHNMPYDEVPLYQAYLSYQDLSDETRKNIDDIADDRLNKKSPEISKIITFMDNYLSEDKLNVWVQVAVDNYNIANDIKFFLQDIFKEINKRKVLLGN